LITLPQAKIVIAAYPAGDDLILETGSSEDHYKTWKVADRIKGGGGNESPLRPVIKDMMTGVECTYDVSICIPSL
jgi:hypothetical protein